MAAPHVSGLVALIWAEYGLALGHMDVKARLMRTVDHIPALERKMLTEGRINAYRALTETLTLTGPHIYSLSPNGGKAGRSVTIFGDNFGETQGSSYVAFYPGYYSRITSWSNTHIECTVPDGCATGEVTVTTAEGTSNGKLFRLGSTIHVDDDACPGTGSGIEADPYCSIQYAIDAATDGDEVLVHDGTYEEDINFKGKVINIRSENGPYVTTIDGGGNGSVVTFDSGEGEYSVLDGLTITNGSGTGGLFGFGGGIYCSKSYPTISNCTISGNSAGMSGGGIYCSKSCPTITNCTTIGIAEHIPASQVNDLKKEIRQSVRRRILKFGRDRKCTYTILCARGSIKVRVHILRAEIRKPVINFFSRKRGQSKFSKGHYSIICIKRRDVAILSL
jgi:hypothetical protein